MKNIDDIVLPDFLIVGAMKAGTTTLMKYLVQHPQIAIPDYEVHFFNDDVNFNKGLEWYSTHFSKSNLIKAVGEKTPTYSYAPKVAERVSKTLPNVKLIWLFRNPVDRTYSNYIHSILRGAEKLSFEKALEKEDERIKKNIFKGYQRRSIYVDQVKRFQKFYSLDKMHFIIFENFIRDPEKHLKNLFNFLGVDYFLNIVEDNGIKANKSYIPFSIKAQYYSYNIFKDSLVHKVINYFNRLFSSQVPPMSNETRTKLNSYFSEYNDQLSELIELDLSVWNEK